MSKASNIKTPNRPMSTYGKIVANEAINELAAAYTSLRFAKHGIADYIASTDNLTGMDLFTMIDTYYQELIDEVIDGILTAHESGAVDYAMRGLQNSMNIQRKFKKSD